MKPEVKTISLSTIIAWATLIPMLWFIGKPVVIKSVSVVMAEEIKQVVKEEVTPLVQSFTILMQIDINSLRKEIAQLEYRQREGINWTVEDAKFLEDKKIELDGLQAALAALQK